MQWLDDYTLDFGDVQFELDYCPSHIAKIATKQKFIMCEAASMFRLFKDWGYSF